jgi:hypothetical protein
MVDDNRQAGAEKVGKDPTPEMIAAGVEIYREWIASEQWDYRIFIANVYRAMAALSCQE